MLEITILQGTDINPDWRKIRDLELIHHSLQEEAVLPFIQSKLSLLLICVPRRARGNVNELHMSELLQARGKYQFLPSSEFLFLILASYCNFYIASVLTYCREFCFEGALNYMNELIHMKQQLPQWRSSNSLLTRVLCRLLNTRGNTAGCVTRSR